MLAAATGGSALYPAILSVTTALPLVALLAGVAAVFTSGVNLAIFDRLMSKVPAGYGVTFNSIDTTVVYVAGSLPPLLVPVLAAQLGISGALVVSSAIGLAGAVLFALDRDRAAPVAEPIGVEAAE